MSALLRDHDDRRMRPMVRGDLDDVMAIETASHERPWTRGNFTDSLASGYVADVLVDDGERPVGYCVAAVGAGEMHLLNLSVAPEQRRRGHASFMLNALFSRCRAEGVAQLWLEVRVSNETARRLYRRLGLQEVGLRRAYYPAVHGKPKARGEDAVLMQMQFGPM